MSHKFIKFAKHKSNESASSGIMVRSRTVGDSRLHLSHGITNVTKAAGTFIALMLAPVIFASNTHAAPYALSISFVDSSSNEDISSPTMELNVSPSKNGTFSKSNTSTIGVGTTSATGYTLSIAASNSNGDKLVNSSDSDTDTNYIASITEGITEETFRALPSNGSESKYNNKWGYLPSMWDGDANNLFRPAPTTAGHVLNTTGKANTVTNNTASDVCKRYDCDKYDITVGARVDVSQKIGTYSNTYVIYATANGTPYTITYKDNTISMPADESSNATGSTVTISGQVPTKDGYTFLGWCTVAPLTINNTDTCSGTKYAAGGTWNITEGAETNNLVLYAMWSGGGSKCNPNGTTIDTINCMQDITSTNKATVLSSMTEDAQYRLVDSRDNQTYWVSKLKDGNIWMTQNLDLNLSTTTALTSDDTDLTAYGSGAYTTANGYSQSGSTIIWTPLRSTINYRSDASTALGSIPGWAGDNNTPSSVDMGDWYWSGAYYSSNNCPSTGDNNYLGCNYATKNPSQYSTYFSTTPYALNGTHGHVGNYYTWSAAVATNDSSSYNASTYEDISKNPTNSICPAGWRLPRASSTAAQSEFAVLNTKYNGGVTNTDAGLIASPLFLTRTGNVWGSALHYAGGSGRYWSSTVTSAAQARNLNFGSGWVDLASSNNRSDGRSLRCLVR